MWKEPFPSGGPPVQLTKNGGVKPLESADGFVYFSRGFFSDEIWKIPAAGGEETLVMKGTGLSDSWNWALAPTGIYFMKGGENSTLFFYAFATRTTVPLVSLGRGGNPAVAPDGNSIVFSRLAQADQTIMIVSHFR